MKFKTTSNNLFIKMVFKNKLTKKNNFDKLKEVKKNFEKSC